MMNASQIREHMEVVGSDGQHVGRVDKVEGDRIKLTRSDPSAQGQHHSLPLSACDRVEGDKVKLSMPAQQAMEMAQGSGGPRMGR
jgi:hypothetical protein